MEIVFSGVGGGSFLTDKLLDGATLLGRYDTVKGTYIYVECTHYLHTVYILQGSSCITQVCKYIYI